MATDARLSQLVAEILRTGTAVPAQVSQVVVEVLRVSGAESPIPTPARLTQHVLEVLAPGAVPLVAARLTQHVLEVLAPGAAPLVAARLTQHVLEVLAPGTAPPAPQPPLPASDATAQLSVFLRAELLLADARIPLERMLAMGAEWGEVLESVLLDGTLRRPVLPARAGQLMALLVTSDKAVQVCVGDVAQNQPLTLQPWGVYALLGGDVSTESACTLSYVAGDGSTATCVVLVLMQAQPPA